jgi:acyl-CoA synthetase (AMP-forming)/AMP-acid ligase II
VTAPAEEIDTEIGAEIGAERGAAGLLEHHATAFPDKAAIIYAQGDRYQYKQMTYGELWDEVERLAAGLSAAGVRQGSRVVLMAGAGPDLYAVFFALLRIGAVPVVVDPGMGVRRMLRCYRVARAETLIGPPIAHLIRMLCRRPFADVRVKITLGRRFWGCHTLSALKADRRIGTEATPTPTVQSDDLMMVAFTTGSTGPAKGVEYTHRTIAAAAHALRSAHARTIDDVCLVTLPLYGVLDLLLGATLVMAPVSPTKVGSADPAELADVMNRYRISTLYASPALLRRFGEYLATHRTAVPGLRCVVGGGAPVAPDIVAALRQGLGATARIHAAYGATEGLPIASIESAEILGETAARSALGDGTCVGRPVQGTDVRIIRVSDGPLPRWDPALLVPPGEIGEIAVAGENISPRYHAAADADAAHKIHEHTRIWHRTGDLGYLDDQGRLWFCGRLSQRVRATTGRDLYTVSCEGVLNAHPLVRRSALVGVGMPGTQRPVVCVETVPEVTHADWPQLHSELRVLAAAQPLTAQLEVFLKHPSFPVDIRHNAKIGRELLARWAEEQLTRPTVRKRIRQWALRAIPLAGWAYLIAGLIYPSTQPVLLALWCLDAFLSVVVHAAQVPRAVRRGRAAGRRAASAAIPTMILGATWWRQFPATARDMGPARPLRLPAAPARPDGGRPAARPVRRQDGAGVAVPLRQRGRRIAARGKRARRGGRRPAVLHRGQGDDRPVGVPGPGRRHVRRQSSHAPRLAAGAGRGGRGAGDRLAPARPRRPPRAAAQPVLGRAAHAINHLQHGGSRARPRLRSGDRSGVRAAAAAGLG